MRVKIGHTEYHLPERIVTNKDLSLENPDWDFRSIESKTGIFCRHIAEKDEKASDLAVYAAEKIFQKGNAERNSIDTLLFCSQSPDFLLPTTACIIQEKLKLKSSTAAFDINLGCSGYIYGLAIASAMIKARISEKVLLLCADTYSKYISVTDRTSRTVFGDGGSATIIECSNNEKSIGPFILGSDGKGWDKIIVRPGFAAAKKEKQNDENLIYQLHIDGPSIFMFSMQRVPQCVNELLTKSKIGIDDIKIFIFHQASKVVFDNIVRILLLDESKVYRCYEKIGNTVSASIPIALKKAEEQNKIREGDLIMLVGFGVGLSWGGCLVKW